MSNVEAIEQQIEKVSPAELAAFRRWYAVFDAEAWDRQFETNVKAGKLCQRSPEIPPGAIM